tara:strand:- start:2601 stop:3029 length:429 start_codon:yes stop_codon:yes gene_type:complete
MSSRINILLFLLLLCIIKVFDVFNFFTIKEGNRCNRSQTQSIDSNKERKEQAEENINNLQPELEYVIDEIKTKQDENLSQTIQNEYIKSRIVDSYDSLYDNIYQRVQIDNDSLVKADKNTILDRVEIILSDTKLSNIPDYKD